MLAVKREDGQIITEDAKPESFEKQLIDALNEISKSLEAIRERLDDRLYVSEAYD